MDDLKSNLAVYLGNKTKISVFIEPVLAQHPEWMIYLKLSEYVSQAMVKLILIFWLLVFLVSNFRFYISWMSHFFKQGVISDGLRIDNILPLFNVDDPIKFNN